MWLIMTTLWKRKIFNQTYSQKSPKGRKLFATKFDNGLAQLKPFTEPEWFWAFFPSPSIWQNIHISLNKIIKQNI